MKKLTSMERGYITLLLTSRAWTAGFWRVIFGLLKFNYEVIRMAFVSRGRKDVVNYPVEDCHDGQGTIVVRESLGRLL